MTSTIQATPNYELCFTLSTINLFQNTVDVNKTYVHCKPNKTKKKNLANYYSNNQDWSMQDYVETALISRINIKNFVNRKFQSVTLTLLRSVHDSFQKSHSSPVTH